MKTDLTTPYISIGTKYNNNPLVIVLTIFCSSITLGLISIVCGLNIDANVSSIASLDERLTTWDVLGEEQSN